MIDNATRISNLPENMYQPLFGVSKQTFDKMLDVLERKHAETHRKGGRKRKLCVLDALVIWFARIRDDRTLQNIAFDYDCQRQHISRIVARVTKSLREDGTFALPFPCNPVKEDAPSVDDTSAVEDAPPVDDTSAVEDAPSVDDTSAVEDAPSVDDTITIDDPALVIAIVDVTEQEIERPKNKKNRK